ncbi:hypothetical protein FHS18_005567 [Paenibacillus phyllosphaerae]|uniref:Uncharacterized protein n=1 Tax=Paenibacillus phyllosphaerae TaxID=274593 RepID=A0A7W5FQG5_9BACL|nr:hypothetical protein [Paenibacillus phyllosphaerae]
MNLSELWRLYEEDKRIQGFSSATIRRTRLWSSEKKYETNIICIRTELLRGLKETLRPTFTFTITNDYKQN